MDAHPLSGLHHETMEEAQHRRESSFEEKIIRKILGDNRMASAKVPLMREQYNAHTNRRLTFFNFHNMFPSFPVYLLAADVPYVYKDCSVEKLFNRFSTRPFVSRYLELAEEEIPEEFEGHYTGMVFPFKGVTRGLILHDKAPDLTVKPKGYKQSCVRMIWTIPGATDYMVLEPFDLFLKSIDPDWIPDDY